MTEGRVLLQVARRLGRIVHDGEGELSMVTAQESADSPAQQYLALLEVSKSVALHRNLPEMFHDLAERLHELFNFHLLTVVLHDAARNVMRVHILETSEPGTLQAGQEYTMEESPSASQWCTHILYILSPVLRKGPGSAITLRRTGAFSFVILRPPTVPAMPKKASFMGWLLRIWRPSCPGNGNGTIPFPGSSSANFDCFWSAVLPHTASCAFTAMPVERT